MDPIYAIIFIALFAFLFLSFRARREIKKVGDDNSAAVKENTAAVREHTEILRQYLALKASETK
ncbi:hypothetical protein J2X76_003808 [Neorhizobium sp. 2083]|uniref:hypothetical protein n=1 Tax=Neorhizobium sp. 2083 TaxID=2817762 RepID=UPI00285F3134|nr:hypothetical protein [Neorhizobium sp. 2083]MDR6818631.1 hypothetical protein [Neorhizobium sp. 2083]